MGLLAKNTQILIGDGQEMEDFDQILGVREISWDGVNFDVEETTNHDDAEPVRSFQKTLYTNGSINLVIDYDPNDSEHALLRALSTSVEARNFQMIQVGGVEAVGFVGDVTAFTFDTPVDGILKANVTILIQGIFTPLAP